jgi:hypothetical protein
VIKLEDKRTNDLIWISPSPSGNPTGDGDAGSKRLFLVQAACLGDPTCIQQRLPAALQAFGRNLAEIYSVFRAAGFQGQLVAVQYYSTDYNNPLTSGAVSALNQVIADVTHAFGGSVADASNVEVGPRCSPRPTGTGETVDQLRVGQTPS